MLESIKLHFICVIISQVCLGVARLYDLMYDFGCSTLQYNSAVNAAAPFEVKKMNTSVGYDAES